MASSVWESAGKSRGASGVRDDCIRIALSTTELAIGGAERCLTEVATRIDRRRFAPVVYSLAAPPANESESILPRLREAGIEVHSLGAKRGIDAPLVFARLARRLRRQRPHVLQTFLFHANMLGRFAARTTGVPHVVSGIRVAQRRPQYRLRMERWTAGLVERHVCVSESVAEFSRDVAGLPAERIVVIPNGIDVAAYDQIEPAGLAALGVAAERRALVFVGRLDEQKGMDWLLDHTPWWMHQLPRHDLVVVGDGPHAEQLQAQARRLNIANRVHFVGWRPDVAAIIRACDLLALPSRWEGMPNVVLEAMACRKSVIANEVEGVRELLGPQADAQICPPGDPQQFVAKLVALAVDPNLAAHWGQENYRRAAQRFSIEAMVRAYESLYEELVGRSSAQADASTQKPATR